MKLYSPNKEGLLWDILVSKVSHSINLSQHGFMKNRSTVSTLVWIAQSQHNAVNDLPKSDIHATFIDFSRVFDTVDHCWLLTTELHAHFGTHVTAILPLE